MNTVTSAPSIAVDGLTATISDMVVLYQLELAVPTGKMTVLLGPSGAGKTTLIKHVVGLVEPDCGAVRIDDRDIWNEATPKELNEIRTSLGAMIDGNGSSTNLQFQSMTVLENLTFCLAAHGVPPKERYDRAMACLRDLDLSADVDRLPETLSIGAKKRLALARALVLEAPLTVLDGIDQSLGRVHFNTVLEAVRNFHHRTNCTLLVTTHDPAVARALAEHLAILINGRIVARGSADELLDGIETAEDFHRCFELFNYQSLPPIPYTNRSATRGKFATSRPSSSTEDATFAWAVTISVILIVFSIMVVSIGLV